MHITYIDIAQYVTILDQTDIELQPLTIDKI